MLTHDATARQITAYCIQGVAKRQQRMSGGLSLQNYNNGGNAVPLPSCSSQAILQVWCIPRLDVSCRAWCDVCVAKLQDQQHSSCHTKAFARAV